MVVGTLHELEKLYMKENNSMNIFNINDMKNGWFIGNFEPSAFKTSYFEIGHHHMKRGEIAIPHIHKQAWELNYIIKGKIKVGKLNDGEVELQQGQIFVYDPHEIADGEAIEDTDLVVVKCPSIPGDKYLV